jgi:cysteine synthase
LCKGGTITSVGRYIKKYSVPTEVVIADPEFSGYFDYVASGGRRFTSPEDVCGTIFFWLLLFFSADFTDRIKD